jgi:putative two-component system response regulator
MLVLIFLVILFVSPRLRAIEKERILNETYVEMHYYNVITQNFIETENLMISNLIDQNELVHDMNNDYTNYLDIENGFIFDPSENELLLTEDLEETVNETSTLINIHIAYSNGNYVSTKSIYNQDITEYTNFDPRNEPYYTNIDDESSVYISDLFLSYESMSFNVYISKGIFNEDNILYGVVSFEVMLSELLLDFNSDSTLSPEGISIVNQDRVIIYKPLVERYAIFNVTDFYGDIDLCEDCGETFHSFEDSFEVYDDDKEEYILKPHLIIIYSSQDNSFQFVRTITTEDLDQLLNKNVYDLLTIIIGISTMIIIVINFLLGRFVLSPINRIKDTMLHIEAQGDKSIRFKEYGNDEFKDITSSFNNYLNEIKRSNDIIIEDTISLRNSRIDLIKALGKAASYRDNDTGNHIIRMEKFATIFGERLNFTQKEIESLCLAIKMHDIGKIGIPDEILQKPAKLDDNERNIIKTHPMIGYNLLSGYNDELLKVSSIVALQHHEKYDGSGYPSNLNGEEIHLYSRIASIIDVFDALTSDRVYKKAWSINKSRDYILNSSGSQFDPNLVKVFEDHFEEFCNIVTNYQDN